MTARSSAGFGAARRRLFPSSATGFAGSLAVAVGGPEEGAPHAFSVGESGPGRDDLDRVAGRLHQEVEAIAIPWTIALRLHAVDLADPVEGEPASAAKTRHVSHESEPLRATRGTINVFVLPPGSGDLYLTYKSGELAGTSKQSCVSVDVRSGVRRLG